MKLLLLLLLRTCFLPCCTLPLQAPPTLFTIYRVPNHCTLERKPHATKLDSLDCGSQAGTDRCEVRQHNLYSKPWVFQRTRNVTLFHQKWRHCLTVIVWWCFVQALVLYPSWYKSVSCILISVQDTNYDLASSVRYMAAFRKHLIWLTTNGAAISGTFTELKYVSVLQ
jgi:hypothetical protein